MSEKNELEALADRLEKVDGLHWGDNAERNAIIRELRAISAKGRPVAWVHDTPYGCVYAFADEVGETFPGLLSRPAPESPEAGAGVEALAAPSQDGDENG